MRKIIILLFLLSAFSCVSSPNSLKQESVGHVVLVWLKDSGNQQHIEQIIAVSKRLKEIPEIKLLHVGTAIPSDRKIVDDSFDVGLYMTFDSVKELESYLTHPQHVDAVKKIIKPLSKRILVYDISI